jgi:hypothetical protein
MTGSALPIQLQIISFEPVPALTCRSGVPGLGASPAATQKPAAHFCGRVSSEAIQFDQNTP